MDNRLEYSADDLVEDLIGDAVRVALAASESPNGSFAPDVIALDVLRLLALCDLRLVADPRGFTRRAIRRVESKGPS